MQRSYRFLAAFAAIALLASCGEKEPLNPGEPSGPDTPPEPEPEEELIPYPQTPEEPDKIYALWAEKAQGLGGDGYFAFAPGVSAILVDNSSEAAESLWEPSSEGRQTLLEGGSVAAELSYTAVYPSGPYAGLDADGRILIDIPSIQNPVKGEVPVPVALGSTTGADRDLRMRAATTVLSFNITRDDILSVMLSGNAGEVISGRVAVADPENPVWEVVDGQSYIMFSSEEPLEPGTYCFSVLPQSFPDGISITMSNTARQQGERLRTAPYEFVRGAFVDAADIDNTKSWGSTYKIASAPQFVSFAQQASSLAADIKVSLALDIDLSGVDVPAIEVFSATFDGAGHALKGWSTTRPLFATLDGTVKDLVIDASCTYTLDASSDAAWFAGENRGVVDAVTVEGAMLTASPLVLASPRSIGGIAAVNYGVLKDCINNGSITLEASSAAVWSSLDGDTITEGSMQYIGGIAGKLMEGSSLLGCKNSGAVSYTCSAAFNSFNAIGGVAGGTPLAPSSVWATKAVASVSGCENSGAVTLSSGVISGANGINFNAPFVGGIVGFLEGSVEGGLNTGEITVNLPMVAWNNNGNANFSRGCFIGGVAGVVTMGASDCIGSGPVDVRGTFAGGASFITANPSVGGLFGVSGSPVSDKVYTLSNCSTTERGSVTARYHMRGGNATAACIGGISGYNTCAVSSCKNAGSLTVYNAFKHLSTGGLVGINKPFKTSGLNISGSSNTGAIRIDGGSSASSVAQAPVGKQSVNFYIGGLVGQSDGVSGAVVTMSNSSNSGAVSLLGGSATNEVTKAVGGLVGYDNGFISHSSCYNTGSVSADTPGNVCAGGIRGVGCNSAKVSGTVTECYNLGTLSIKAAESNVGGIEGFNNNNAGNGVNQIVLCTNGEKSSDEAGSITVEASGIARVGGIRGYAYKAVALSCENFASIEVSAKGDAYAGGIGGQHRNDAPRANNCTNNGSISVTGSGNNTYAGGIYGGINGQVNGCTNNGSITVSSSSPNIYAGGLIGRIGATFATGSSTGNVSVSYTGSASPNVYISPVCGYAGAGFTAYGTFGGVYTLTGVSSGNVYAGAAVGLNAAADAIYYLGLGNNPLCFSRSLSLLGTAPTEENVQDEAFLFGGNSGSYTLHKVIELGQ